MHCFIKTIRFIWALALGLIIWASPIKLLSKNINIIKTRPNWKWKIPYTVLERWTMWFSSYKNCKLTVKLRLVGARKRRKIAFFITFILSEECFFLHFCFVSMYSALNKLSEYIKFYLSKYITLYTFATYFWNRRKPSVHP